MQSFEARTRCDWLGLASGLLVCASFLLPSHSRSISTQRKRSKVSSLPHRGGSSDRCAVCELGCLRRTVQQSLWYSDRSSQSALLAAARCLTASRVFRNRMGLHRVSREGLNGWRCEEPTSAWIEKGIEHGRVQQHGQGK